MISKKNLKKRYSQLWVATLKGNFHKFVFLISVTILSTAADSYIPILTKDFIDNYFSAQKNFDTLLYISIFAIICILLKVFSQTLTVYLANQLGWKATNKLRETLYQKTLRLPLKEFKSNPSGHFIERIDGDVNKLSNFFSMFVIEVLSSFLLILFILFSIYTVNSYLFIAMVVNVALSFAAINYVRKFSSPLWVKTSEKKAKLTSFLSEVTHAHSEIRNNRGIKKILVHTSNLLENLFSTSHKAYVYGRSVWPTSMLMIGFSQVSLLSFASYLYLNDEITVGSLILLIQYTNMIRRPVSSLGEQIEDLQKAGASIKRVTQFMEQVTESDEDKKYKPFTEKVKQIQFKDVSHHFNDKNNILNNLNICIPNNSSVGIIGKSGVGKSTLTNILMKFVIPSSGEILVNGKSLADIDTGQWRQKIVYIPQNSDIFQGSIRENFTLFKESASDEEIYQALKEVGLDAWIKEKKEGLDFNLAEGGKNISTGEAHLLAFARVYLRDPEIVIFDEHTTHVEPQTEELLFQKTESIEKNRICFKIAHKTKTLKNTDYILYLENDSQYHFGKTKDILQIQDTFIAKIRQEVYES